MTSHDDPTTALRLEFLLEVIERARQHERGWFGRLRAEIAAWASYQIVYGRRYEIDHDGDPPWDHSGELRAVADGFDPQEYETLGEFLDEPTGERSPSFERGHGWYFDTYGKNLDELVRDFVSDRLLEVARGVARERSLDVGSLLGEGSDEGPPQPAHELSMPDLWELDQATRHEPLCEYASLDLELRWREEIEGWLVRELLEEGSAAAHLRRHGEKVVAAEQRKMAAERAVRSRAVFSLFVKDFEEHIGPFPKHHHFTKKDPFWPQLQRLLLDRWTSEERSLISDHLPSSTTIDAFLKGQ